MPRLLPILSLLISLLALTLALQARHQTAAAIHAREQSLIQHLKPRLDQIYSDFNTPLSPEQKNPQSIEDLLDPLFQLIQPIPARPTPGLDHQSPSSHVAQPPPPR